MITRRFIKSSIIYTLSGALPTASAVLLLPFYLLYLPAQQYGALVLYLSFSILIQIIVTYSFDASLYLHFHDYKNDPRKLSSFVSSAFTFIILLGAVVAGLLMITGGMLFHYFYKEHELVFYPYGFFSALTGIFQAIFKVNNTFLQSREKPVEFFRSNLISATLVGAFTIGGLYLWPGTLEGPVLGRMVAFFMSAGWVLYRIYREYGFHFDFSLLRTTLAYNTYQSIYQLQLWVINYFDRFLMAMIVVLTDVGIYDFALKYVMVLDLVISGLFNSFFPKILSRTAGQNIEGTSIEINRYYHGLTALIMLMVSGTILVLPVLISVLVKKPGYEAAVDFVPYASLIFLFRGMRFYFGLPYNTMKYSKPLPLIFIIVAVVKTALAWWLIRDFGIYGAIAATLAAGGMEIVLLWLWMKDRFSYFFNPLKLIAGPLFLMFAVIFAEPVFHTTYAWQVHLAYVFFTLLLLTWLYRKEFVLLDFKKL